MSDKIMLKVSKTSNYRRNNLPPVRRTVSLIGHIFNLYLKIRDLKGLFLVSLFLVSFSGVSRENSTGELQTSRVPVPRHESFYLNPFLRSVKVTSIINLSVIQELKLLINLLSFISHLPFLPLVKWNLWKRQISKSSLPWGIHWQ